MSDMVKLNVGGRRFETTWTTLLCAGSSHSPSFFAALRPEGSRFAQARDEGGALFIDRPGDLFAVLLDYLRTGSLHLPRGISPEQVDQEALFYGIRLPPGWDNRRGVATSPVFSEMMAVSGGRPVFCSMDLRPLAPAVLRAIAPRKPMLMFCNLSRTCLAGAIFRNACLAGASLDGADLSGAQFVACDLSSVSFEGANLSRAVFQSVASTKEWHIDDCVLENAVFDGAELEGAVFVGANLRGASFRGAGMCKCSFRCLYTDTSGAPPAQAPAAAGAAGAPATPPMSPLSNHKRCVCFQGAEFRGAKLDGARFIEHDTGMYRNILLEQGANLQGAVFIPGR
eukprot:m51a1_g14427 hypothetical protein (340) ;mRNA; f:509507-511007